MPCDLFSADGLVLMWSCLAINFSAPTGRLLEPEQMTALRPWVLLLLLVCAAGCYVRGARRARWRYERSGYLRPWRLAASVGGWLALGAALLAPLPTLLYTAQTARLTLLTFAAAPLLVLGRPWLVLWWGAPQAWRRRLKRSGGAGALNSVWAVLKLNFGFLANLGILW
jgi:cytochrome c oxidase assembly factor CtaG